MNEQPHNQLSAYLDQELDAGHSASFEAHLQECPACRAELDEHLALHRLLEVLPPVPQQTSTAQFWQELEPQLRPRRTRLGLAWLWGLALVAAVVVVQAFFIALRLANILDAAGWLPAFESPIGLRNWWDAEYLLAMVRNLFWHNSLLVTVLETPVVSLLPYLFTLILSSILALIFLGWAYAYLCSQSTSGCQPIREQ